MSSCWDGEDWGGGASGSGVFIDVRATHSREVFTLSRGSTARCSPCGVVVLLLLLLRQRRAAGDASLGSLLADGQAYGALAPRGDPTGASQLP